ncbi:hypothetical protein A2853_01655 [Candidatus Kaiserbacteria bacterium RIFCSPHIGHO2_01_FULL_55_17]|uniref:CARDB domain-containing protein n=1 Tax=Candidatus Kaiserbacteria bacterium RIFCSPHIGHO2_01_FULL_55_17 TaxID=1798484 RepID=A0A1F6D854_9BACT|nr:MAG: hypothetical protein A2853_01655 [Candidatus Kaiserbacteria bacterium RIFCSPHIGHO2_01_FULL_55_17]
MAESQQSATRVAPVQEEPKASLASNILAIVGFIILIVVVIWGLVHLANISRTWFSSLFGKSDAAIEVTVPESAVSGIPLTVSWKYDESVSGTYAFLYQCEGGLAFQTPGPLGALNSIPCGAAFTIAGESKSVSVTPMLSGDASLDVPISIIFMPTATGTQAQGSATVRISPATSLTPTPEPSPTPTPAPQPEPTPTPSTSSGQAKTPADLSVRVVAVTVDAYGNGIATFDIKNIGGTSSGIYYFSALLPTLSGYTYVSPAQSSLAPEAHVVSTLRFSQAHSGTFSVSITTPDANGSNNYASQLVNAPSSFAPGYGGTQQYQTYPYTYPSNYYQPYMQYSPYSAYYPYAY